MQHNFDISIATKYGVNVAIFLNNLAFWVHKNMANEKHFYDGMYWTYNSQKSLTKLFPYWSRQNLRTVIKSALDHNLIMTGNYNENKYDQTTWYSLTPLGLSLFNCFGSIQTPPVDNSSTNGVPTGENQPITGRETTNDSSVRINQPIPDIKPYRKPDREIAPKNGAPHSVFQPDEKNTKACQVLGLDLKEELESFEERGPFKKTQYEFKRWLDSSKEYKDRKKKAKDSQEIKSTVKEWGPGHPTWEANRSWDLINNKHVKANPVTVVKRSEKSNTNSRGIGSLVKHGANLGVLKHATPGSAARIENGSHYSGGKSMRKVEDYLFQ